MIPSQPQSHDQTMNVGNEPSVLGNPHGSGSGSAEGPAIGPPPSSRLRAGSTEITDRKRTADQRSPSKDSVVAARPNIMNIHDATVEGTIAAIKRQIDADAVYARTEIEQLKNHLKDRDIELQNVREYYAPQRRHL